MVPPGLIQQVLGEPDWRGRLTSVDLRALSPLKGQHINPCGTFTLNMSRDSRIARDVITGMVVETQLLANIQTDQTTADPVLLNLLRKEATAKLNCDAVNAFVRARFVDWSNSTTSSAESRFHKILDKTFNSTLRGGDNSHWKGRAYRR